MALKIVKTVNFIRPFAATWIDLESVISSEVSYRGREGEMLYDIPYMWDVKPGGRDSYGVWEGHVHAAVFKMDKQ